MILEEQQNKTAKWFLLPTVLILGTLLLFAFVQFSQDYLSDYFVQNSKSLIGQKVDLQKLSEHLGEKQLLEFTSAHGHLGLELVFWSTSCSPCLKHLSSLQRQSSGRLIIPINTDPLQERDAAEKTLHEMAPQYSFYRDNDGIMLKAFKIDYLPAVVFLSRQGIIENMKAGSLAQEQ